MAVILISDKNALSGPIFWSSEILSCKKEAIGSVLGLFWMDELIQNLDLLERLVVGGLTESNAVLRQPIARGDVSRIWHMEWHVLVARNVAFMQWRPQTRSFWWRLHVLVVFHQCETRVQCKYKLGCLRNVRRELMWLECCSQDLVGLQGCLCFGFLELVCDR